MAVAAAAAAALLSETQPLIYCFGRSMNSLRPMHGPRGSRCRRLVAGDLPYSRFTPSGTTNRTFSGAMPTVNAFCV